MSTPLATVGPTVAASAAAAPTSSSAFTLMKMATAADLSKSAPDAATFTDTFATTAPAIFVVFALRSGLAGTVSCSMTANGVQVIQPLTIAYKQANTWGDFRISSRGKFVSGAYTATLTFAPTGEKVSVNFTVK
ncbi:MAG: hypothetical protein NVS9B8_06060 [Candidatus Limnocylindrales bacterium]